MTKINTNEQRFQNAIYHYSNASDRYTSDDEYVRLHNNKAKEAKNTIVKDTLSTDDSKPSSIPQYKTDITIYDADNNHVTSISKNPPIDVVTVRQESDNNSSTSTPSQSCITLIHGTYAIPTNITDLELALNSKPYPVLPNFEPVTQYTEHRSNYTPTPDDPRLSTTSSDTLHHNRTLKKFKIVCFELPENTNTPDKRPAVFSTYC